MKKLDFFRSFTSLVACGAVLMSVSMSTTSCTSDKEKVDPVEKPDNGDEDDDKEPEVIEGLVLKAARSDWHSTWADKSDVIGVINSANLVTPIEFSKKYDAFVLEDGLLPVEAAEHYFVIYPYAEEFTYIEDSFDATKVAYLYELPTSQDVAYNDNGSVDTYELRKNNVIFGATKEAVDIVEGECELALTDVNATVKVTITGLVPESVVTDVTFSADAISPASTILSISKTDGTSESIIASGDDSTISKINVDVDDVTIGENGELVTYVTVLPQTIVEGTVWSVDVDTTEGAAGETVEMTIPAGDMEAGKCYSASVEVQGYDRVSYTLAGTSLKDMMASEGIDYTNVSHLTLSGAVTQEDMEFTREFPVINMIDLTQASSAVIPAYLYSDDTSSKNTLYGDQEKCAASKSLREFRFPMAFETIEGFVFERCAKLESVTLPINVKVLSASIFESCNQLDDIELPTSVEVIGSWLFEKTRVPNLVLPESVIEVGSGVFSSMKSYQGVESITLMMDPAKVTWKGTSNTFQSMSTDIEIRVPAQYLDAYKALSQLEKVASQVVAIEE